MNGPLVLIVEQVAAEPAECFFTGSLWPLGMSMKVKGTKLDEQTWPIWDALTEHLDAEVIGLEEHPIPATCTVGKDLRTQPVGAVNSIGFISFLRR